MKRAGHIAAAALCCLMLSALIAHAAAPRPAWVIPSVLNVHQSRGLDSPEIGSLPRGTKVYVIAFNDRWCHISYDGGKRGWAAEWLLQFSADAGRKLAAEASKQPAQPAANPAAWVKVEGAILRAGPGTEHRRITGMDKGTKLYLVGQSGSWRRLKLASGVAGWMRADLLETNVARGQKLAGQPSTGQAEPAKAFIADDNVNIRKSPSTSAQRVDQLDRGTMVWVIDAQNDWRKVKYGNGEGGWVAEGLLKAPGSAPAPSREIPRPTVEPESAPDPEPPLESMYGWVADPEARMRYGPGMQFDVKREVPEGTKVTVVDVEGHWCKVRVGPQEYGWMAAWYIDFLGAGNQVFGEEGGEPVQVHVGWATGSAMSLHAGPGDEHKRLATLPRGTELVILDSSGDWYQVVLSDNRVGWIKSRLVGTREEALARGEVPLRPGRAQEYVARAQALEDPIIEAPGPSATSFGMNLARTALMYLGRGIRYVWGGSEPSRGLDCSGFVRHVLGKFGLGLPHNAAQQFKLGSPVGSGMLRPGDLVFFKETGRAGISHVGIYIGGGQFVHSSSARGGMVVSTLRTGYYAHKYAGARRLG